MAFKKVHLKAPITYMVASHLQGDIESDEEGGCGLIHGLVPFAK